MNVAGLMTLPPGYKAVTPIPVNDAAMLLRKLELVNEQR